MKVMTKREIKNSGASASKPTILADMNGGSSDFRRKVSCFYLKKIYETTGPIEK